MNNGDRVERLEDLTDEAQDFLTNYNKTFETLRDVAGLDEDEALQAGMEAAD